jgi:hypothetical protein
LSIQAEKAGAVSAALLIIANGNAEALCLVGEIAGDAGAGHDHAGRHDVEDVIVPLERVGLAVAQSGLNAICITLRRSAQQAAAFSVSFGVPPCISNHVGRPSAHLAGSNADYDETGTAAASR